MMDDFSPGDGLFLPPHECTKPYSVSQINEAIGSLIESAAHSVVWVEAEISDFRQASSGHWYFRLKDEFSQIPAVMWRSMTLKHSFTPENGMAVSVIAAIRVYRKGGYYQLEVMRLQKEGAGARFIALERLKAKLLKEGLFDQSRKKPLPERVQVVGVITSKQGAAIHDILKVVATRAPRTDVLICNVPVQGEKAPLAICKALEIMNRNCTVDCIIVGRGGGSVEDLWCFNDEMVVRAIASSAIAVISAIGHETDYTLADFAADLRAPTPSVAAEMAVPDTTQINKYFLELRKRFTLNVQYCWRSIRMRYEDILRQKPLRYLYRYVEQSRQEIDLNIERLHKAMIRVVENRKSNYVKIGAHLNAVNPLAILMRGYSITMTPDGIPVKDSSRLTIGDLLRIRLHSGELDARVEAIFHEPSSGTGSK